jgi:hypothetical protein
MGAKTSSPFRRGAARAPVIRDAVIRRHHSLCSSNRAGNGIHGASEVNQHAVAHDLYDATMMLVDRRTQNTIAPLIQHSQRAGLVHFDEAAIANHVSGEDGGKPAFDRGVSRQTMTLRSGNSMSDVAQ